MTRETDFDREREGPALIAAWTQIASSIRNQKRELWQVTYYVLLFVAAIFAGLQGQNPLLNFRYAAIASWVFASGVALWGSFYVWRGFFTISRYRASQREIERELGGRFWAAMEAIGSGNLRGLDVPLVQSLSIIVLWMALSTKVFHSLQTGGQK